MAFGIPDELLPVFVPPAVYWMVSGIYHMVLGSTEKHRLFTKEEEAQNLATRRQVVVGVLINQGMQMLLVALLFVGGGGMLGAAGAPPPSVLQVVQQLGVGILFMDAWQYFWHRWTHESKFLYKHVHAMHHLLFVPYAYGAQFIHPLDSLGGEVVGGTLATLVCNMTSPRVSTLFFTLLTLKAVDDHCGLWFPNHPVHRFLTNNSAFHAVHHQHQGIKYNYSGHFLATWDRLLGTHLPFSVEEREGGGYQIRIARKTR